MIFFNKIKEQSTLIFKNIKSIGLVGILLLPIVLISKHLKSLENYVVKSDDESIELLLKKDSDKVKFQYAVDELLKENRGSKKEIEIKDRKITISI